MYFADFTSYSYQTLAPLTHVRAVGWLDGIHPFSTGEVDEPLRLKLRDLAAHARVRRMRGTHICEICDTEWLRRYDPLVLLGSAEIWIPDSLHGYFAAPDLIIHYIEEHRYLPSREFLSALAIVNPSELGHGWEATVELIASGGR